MKEFGLTRWTWIKFESWFLESSFSRLKNKTTSDYHPYHRKCTGSQKLYEPIKRQCFGLCNCTYNPYWWCFWWLRKLYWYCRTCCWASLESIGRSKQWLLTPLFVNYWSFNSQKQIDRQSVSQIEPKNSPGLVLNQSLIPIPRQFHVRQLGEWGLV